VNIKRLYKDKKLSNLLSRLEKWIVEYVTAAVAATNGTPATNSSTGSPPTPYIPATYTLLTVATSTGFTR
jgi:hypothetical protein